jgi:hypothetical protein
MYQAVKDKIITVREAVGVDVHIGQDDQWQITGMHVKFVKKKLGIVATYGDLEDIRSHMPRNVPLVLLINGRGILMRETAAKEVNVIGQLFPGANPNHFYSMPYRISETMQYAFICRKTLVEQVMQVLAAKGLRPLTVTVGLSPLKQVLPFLDTAALEVTSPGYKVSVKQNEIVAIVYGEQPADIPDTAVRVGDQPLRRSHVTLLGAIMQVLLKPVDRVDDPADLPAALTARQEYTYFRLFWFGTWLLLTVVLTLLVINFMVFSHFFNRNSALSQQIGQMNDAAAGNEGQQNEFNATYAFFTAAGWNKTTRHGFYIDHIAALTPASIRLTVLQTASQEETFGSDLVFRVNKIQVNGISTDPTELEIFSRAIRNIPGVEAVSMNDYLYKREMSAAVFSIEVTIRI